MQSKSEGRRPAERITRLADMALPEGKVLLVCGGPNWKPQDRFLDSEIIRPVEVISRDGISHVPYFDRHKDFGVSCVQVDVERNAVIYAISEYIFRVDLDTGERVTFDVPNLDDVHELTLVGDRLLVSNTGKDEVLELEPATGAVLARHALKNFRASSARPIRSTRDESFHCNQAFLGDNGDLMALAHHAYGFRVLTHAQRQLVRHGSGGILNLTTGDVIDLRLFGPHNVRRHASGWLINNSGRSEVMLLTPEWEVVGNIELVGWGTGAAVSEDGTVLFGGIRATRRRYAKVGDRSETGVQVVPLGSGQCQFLPLPNKEQVNNIELLDEAVAKKLIDLPARSEG